MEGAHSQHTKPDEPEEEQALLICPAAAETTALQLQANSQQPGVSPHQGCSKERYLVFPDLVKTSKLSQHQPWKGQEGGHGISRKSVSYTLPGYGTSQPRGAHTPEAAQRTVRHTALVVVTLKAASSIQN